MYPLPTLITPVPLIPFTTEESAAYTNEVAKCAHKGPRNLPP